MCFANPLLFCSLTGGVSKGMKIRVNERVKPPLISITFEMSLQEYQNQKDERQLDPENWSNISFKQIVEELVEIKKRLCELEAYTLRPKSE
jgi:hypothetical protein